MDLLSDPFLQPHFVWDAQRLYKHNGERFERFVDEPWTGNRWWNIQVCRYSCISHCHIVTNVDMIFTCGLENKSDLPGDNAAPFAFILYADKSHLSTSGNVKAYPVIARCGNLPVDIRNGNRRLGGGQLMGWLPVVSYSLICSNHKTLMFSSIQRFPETRKMMASSHGQI